jgi:hypothetical protein
MQQFCAALARTGTTFNGSLQARKQRFAAISIGEVRRRLCSSHSLPLCPFHFA